MLQLVATVVTVQQKSKVKESVYLLFNTALPRLFYDLFLVINLAISFLMGFYGPWS